MTTNLVVTVIKHIIEVDALAWILFLGYGRGNHRGKGNRYFESEGVRA